MAKRTFLDSELRVKKYRRRGAFVMYPRLLICTAQPDFEMSDWDEELLGAGWIWLLTESPLEHGRVVALTQATQNDLMVTEFDYCGWGWTRLGHMGPIIAKRRCEVSLFDGHGNPIMRVVCSDESVFYLNAANGHDKGPPMQTSQDQGTCRNLPFNGALIA